MNLKQSYIEFSRLSKYMQSIALLFARLTVAYGFYQPAMMKWNSIDSVSDWFVSLGIPFPTFSAYLAATFETIGVALLAFGLFTRLISIPLIIIMIVAIFTVHISNGFSAGDNGFEIPFYYMLFLMMFFSYGGGKFSLDNLFFNTKSN